MKLQETLKTEKIEFLTLENQILHQKLLENQNIELESFLGLEEKIKEQQRESLKQKLKLLQMKRKDAMWKFFIIFI